LTPALADFVAIQLVLLSIGSSFSWSNGDEFVLALAK
jgi:hypothetical protein